VSQSHPIRFLRIIPKAKFTSIGQLYSSQWKKNPGVSKIGLNIYFYCLILLIDVITLLIIKSRISFKKKCSDFIVRKCLQVKKLKIKGKRFFSKIKLTCPKFSQKLKGKKNTSIIPKFWGVLSKNYCKNHTSGHYGFFPPKFWNAYTGVSQKYHREKKREYLGKCNNLDFKEKKSYLKR
jgi:hypothetical protein